MPEHQKGKSPFYPGQPVPAELFVGRARQIRHLLERGAAQVRSGKPIAAFVQGEYGIGKSSIASLVQQVAEREYGLYPIYGQLGGTSRLDEVAEAVLEATIRSGAFEPSRAERIREFLGRYIGEQGIFGISLRLDQLRADAPTLSRPSGILDFLSQVLERLKSTGIGGIMLVLDEINGIAGNEQFAHFIKGLVDANAVARAPLPLFLVVCGVEERRRQMIRCHQPIDRIFDVVEIEALTDAEMSEFFSRAFLSARIAVDDAAMKILTTYSAGFPKIMHLVGDAAFWLDKDDRITAEEAWQAVVVAAEEVGKKYVDQQVYNTLKSADYRSILRKIAASGISMEFRRGDVAKGLTPAEARKLNNFLQKMKRLDVIRPGDVKGEWVFNVRMVRLYIWLQAQRQPRST